jgi:xanthine dehydrogenase YagR molybdenum-binding subunit
VAAVAGMNVDLLASDASASSVALPKESALGASLSRAEGSLKVSGHARYAIEKPLENMAYGVTVQSTRLAGRVVSINTTAAKALPGVIDVYTAKNTLKLNKPTFYGAGGGATEVFTPIQDDMIRFNGMHIALVVEETFEQVTEAASLLNVAYDDASAIIDFDNPKAKSQPMDAMGAKWGERADGPRQCGGQGGRRLLDCARVQRAARAACLHRFLGGRPDHRLEAKPSGSAVRAASSPNGSAYQSKMSGSSRPTSGGGFGSKIGAHPHVGLACAASRMLGRPVKVSLTRPQTFTGLGGRPATRQNIAIGADKDGKIVSIVHESWNETAIDEVHVEACNNVTRSCTRRRTLHRAST